MSRRDGFSRRRPTTARVRDPGNESAAAGTCGRMELSVDGPKTLE